MIDKLFNFDKFDNIGITGLTTELTSFCVDNIYKKSKRNILLVTNSLYEANQIYSSLSNLNNHTHLFPNRSTCYFT